MTEGGRRQSGFLVLADISGYTAFLTGTELEHAQGIIEDLTRAILASLTPALTLVKLEGDAAFAFARDGSLSADRVFDLVERGYVDFCDTRDTMVLTTTCRCNACANIASLDLKFLVHRGEFVTQTVAGVEDLAGPDVILVHRLLKNRVREATGCSAYAFFTAAVLEMVPGIELTAHVEATPEFGEVAGGVLDLHGSLARMRETRRVQFAPGESDFAFVTSVNAPPAVAWEWWTNPERAATWQADLDGMRVERNDAGRQGVGGGMHCAHGSFDTFLRYIDWQPFTYISGERRANRGGLTTPPPMTETVDFVANEAGGTDIVYRLRTNDRGVRTRLKLLVMRPALRRIFSGNARGLARELSAQQQPDAEAAATE